MHFKASFVLLLRRSVPNYSVISIYLLSLRYRNFCWADGSWEVALEDRQASKN